VSGCLIIRNRQRRIRLNVRRLARLIRELLRTLPHVHEFEIGVFIVDAADIERLNSEHLQHAGATDVITFAYHQAPSEGTPFNPLHADIFVCMEKALRQARRFRTTWQSELVRYVIHGLLHACGYDDRQPAARRRMKREEDRLLRLAAPRSVLSTLGGYRT
jgi:probable rRNA maturation factor